MTPLTHESLHAQLQCFGRRACAGRALHAGPHRQRVVQAHGSEGTGAARARPRSRGEEVEAVCQWAKRRAGPARGRTRDPLPGRPAEPRLLDRGCVAVAGDAQLGLLRSALHASPDGIPPVHLRALQRMGAARCAGCPTRAAGAARSQPPHHDLRSPGLPAGCTRLGVRPVGEQPTAGRQLQDLSAPTRSDMCAYAPPEQARRCVHVGRGAIRGPPRLGACHIPPVLLYCVKGYRPAKTERGCGNAAHHALQHVHRRGRSPGTPNEGRFAQPGALQCVAGARLLFHARGLGLPQCQLRTHSTRKQQHKQPWTRAHHRSSSCSLPKRAGPPPRLCHATLRRSAPPRALLTASCAKQEVVRTSRCRQGLH
jgi:hypothetical protein